MNVMQQLHASEINSKIESFWDGCWTWSLGDEMNGFTESRTALSFEQAEQELATAAARKYPDSAFAKARS